MIKRNRLGREPLVELHTRYLARRIAGDSGTAFVTPIYVTDPRDHSWTFKTFDGQRGSAVIRKTHETAERDGWDLHRRVEQNALEWSAIYRKHPEMAVHNQ